VAKQQTIKAETGGTVNVVEKKEKVSAEKVENMVVHNEVPPWVILLLVIGWLLPSPGEISRWLTSLFKRKK